MSSAKAKFSCGCISTNIPNYDGGSSVNSNKDGSTTWTFSIPCCQCDRRKVKAAQAHIESLYNPRINEMRAQIQRAEERIWKGPVLEGLVEAKDERVREVGKLEGEMRGEVDRCWEGFEKRWGLMGS